MSNEEKIQELTYLIIEQEKELNVLKLLAEKKNYNKDTKEFEKKYNEAELIIDLSKLENKLSNEQQQNELLIKEMNQKSKLHKIKI